jgi:hypothetical protein
MRVYFTRCNYSCMAHSGLPMSNVWDRLAMLPQSIPVLLGEDQNSRGVSHVDPCLQRC